MARNTTTMHKQTNNDIKLWNTDAGEVEDSQEVSDVCLHPNSDEMFTTIYFIGTITLIILNITLGCNLVGDQDLLSSQAANCLTIESSKY